MARVDALCARFFFSNSRRSSFIPLGLAGFQVQVDGNEYFNGGRQVDDVAQGGYAADRASVRQKKTGRPVKFELTESTRQAIDDLRVTGRK